MVWLLQNCLKNRVSAKTSSQGLRRKIMTDGSAIQSHRGLEIMKFFQRSSVLVIFILATSSITVQLSAAETITSSGYLLGPEDVLEISVWKEESLQREVLVRPDGKISFPLVGDVHAEGKTPEQLRHEIAGWLKKYIPDPVVTILVTKVAGYKIYVIGQVKKAGQYAVGQYLDVLQALALAGGLTPFAAEGKIKIIRRESGTETVIPFDFSEVKKGQKLEQNIILRSGDVVVVP